LTNFYAFCDLVALKYWALYTFEFSLFDFISFLILSPYLDIISFFSDKK